MKKQTLKYKVLNSTTTFSPLLSQTHIHLLKQRALIITANLHTTPLPTGNLQNESIE